MRGYARSGVVEKIRAAGGEVFAVTSEPQSLASEAEQEWAFGFSAVGDPHHEILATCRERGWLDLFIQDAALLAKARSWVAHPKGHFQPGVLALEGRGRVLYRWRCRPARANAGGAVARPTPHHVWAELEARLEGPPGDAPLDEAPELDHRPVPWPLFVASLLAHGWFVRPKPFPLGRAGDPPSASPAGVLPRIPAFVLAWVAAFWLLPAGWVLLALVAWVALVTPRVVEIQRAFQNVPSGEPGNV